MFKTISLLPLKLVILLLFYVISLLFLTLLTIIFQIHRLQHWFGISSTALNLLSTFLSDRYQTLIASNSKSQPVLLEYGVPQGSVLGPLLYSLYTIFTTLLLSVISKYPGIRRHFYADDTQIYLSFSPELTTVFSLIESCIKDIFSWMVANKLSVNLIKTEYLLFNPKHFYNLNCSINIDSNIISTNDSAKNLAVVFQSDMSMDKHISAIVKSCFLLLRDFHRIRPLISKTTVITLAKASVHSHLDYCNSLFCGLPKYYIHHLQKYKIQLLV